MRASAMSAMIWSCTSVLGNIRCYWLTAVSILKNCSWPEHLDPRLLLFLLTPVPSLGGTTLISHIRSRASYKTNSISVATTFLSMFSCAQSCLCKFFGVNLSKFLPNKPISYPSFQNLSKKHSLRVSLEYLYSIWGTRQITDSDKHIHGNVNWYSHYGEQYVSSLKN